MVGVFESKREQIAVACARHGVLRLDAFGSAVRGDFRQGDSDVDLLVEFGPMDVYARVDASFDLLDEFSRLLKKAHLPRWSARALAAAYPQVRLTRPFAPRLASGPF